MCRKINTRPWCLSGEHFFGVVDVMFTQQCKEVRAKPSLGTGGCNEGLIGNKNPVRRPEYFKCDGCATVQANEAYFADDEKETKA